MNKSILAFAFSFCALLPAWSQAQPVISEGQAIELAEQEMINQGGSLEWIGETKILFDNECNCYGILFSGKPTPNGGYILGDHVVAEVSADGSTITLRSGY